MLHALCALISFLVFPAFLAPLIYRLLLTAHRLPDFPFLAFPAFLAYYRPHVSPVSLIASALKSLGGAGHSVDTDWTISP